MRINNLQLFKSIFILLFIHCPCMSFCCLLSCWSKKTNWQRHPLIMSRLIYVFSFCPFLYQKTYFFSPMNVKTSKTTVERGSCHALCPFLRFHIDDMQNIINKFIYFFLGNFFKMRHLMNHKSLNLISKNFFFDC